jgi:hypothetical protein
LEKEDLTKFIGALQEDARAWLAKVFTSLPQQDMVRVVVTLRAIWYARRKAIYENSYQGPLSTHCFIDRFIADLGEPASKKSTERIPTGRLYPSWIPPPYGCAKINVDASTSKNSALASIAAVARDDSGNFMGASAVVVYGITEPEILGG